MKKYRIFLGAYVNFANAQNVNCDKIAQYLDKDKFEVHTMYTTMCPVDKAFYKSRDIHLHMLWHHRIVWRMTKLMAMYFGKYDIYYLPKLESMDIQFAKRYIKDKKKLFITSVEGVVGEQIPGDDEEVKSQYLLFDNMFSISNCVKNSVKEHWGEDTQTLYLGIDPSAEVPAPKAEVKNIVWVGSVIDRKRPEYLLECAKVFPHLSFTMIGDGDQSKHIESLIAEQKISNVKMLGRIPNEEVYSVLNDMDLLLMTSDKEGLPKVIGEAMSKRIPSIYINECYDVDYIENGVNGYGVANLNEMQEKLQYLIDNPEKYRAMSETAYKTIQKYTWSHLIKDYEEYFISEYNKKSEFMK